MLADVVRTHGGHPPNGDVRAWMGADKRDAVAALLVLTVTDPTVAAAQAAFTAEPHRTP